MGKGSARGGWFRRFVQFGILPLLLLDGYAAWQLTRASEQWHIRLLPGDLPGSLSALVTLLAFNAAVVAILALTSRR